MFLYDRSKIRRKEKALEIGTWTSSQDHDETVLIINSLTAGTSLHEFSRKAAVYVPAILLLQEEASSLC